jgi:hypothetical protein
LSETASDPMDGIDEKYSIHSFIVRMWLEEVDENTHRGNWRGRITHIPTGKQQYFIDMKSISAFIQSYLDAKE